MKGRRDLQIREERGKGSAPFQTIPSITCGNDARDIITVPCSSQPGQRSCYSTRVKGAGPRRCCSSIMNGSQDSTGQTCIKGRAERDAHSLLGLASCIQGWPVLYTVTRSHGEFERPLLRRCRPGNALSPFANHTPLKATHSASPLSLSATRDFIAHATKHSEQHRSGSQWSQSCSVYRRPSLDIAVVRQRAANHRPIISAFATLPSNGRRNQGPGEARCGLAPLARAGHKA